MFNLVRDMFAGEAGPILEIGSYVEAQQDHLNLRAAVRRNARYVGIDVNPGTGVDIVADFMDEKQMAPILADLAPRVVLCLYVVEHVWEIDQAMRALANIWQQHRESWMLVATHQSQPFHGTEKYGDYWRLTLPALRRLAVDTGFPPPAHVYGHHDTSNPDDVIFVRQPASMPWPWPLRGERVEFLTQWSELP